MVAIDLNFFDGLVNCSKSTGHLRSIRVGKLVGEGNQIFLLRNHVVGHSAIALPPVGASELLAGARDHIAAPAIVAYSATRDVIHDYSVAHAKTSASWTNIYDLTARLVSCDHSLIAFGAFAQVLVVNTSNVGTTNRGGLDLHENFAVKGTGYGNRAEIESIIAGQKRSSHALFHSSCSLTSPHTCSMQNLGWRNLAGYVPQVLPGLSFFPQKHLAFYEPAIPIDGADLTHFLISQGIAYHAFEIVEVVIAVG